MVAVTLRVTRARHAERDGYGASARRGFTLLEVMLATAIGLLLLGALYAAMSIQIRQADNGREVVEKSMVARAILARMSRDAMDTLPVNAAAVYSAVQASRGSSGGGGGAGGGAGAGGAGGGAGGAGGAAGGGAAGGGTGSNSGGSGTSAVGGTGAFNFSYGVQGDKTWLILFVSQVPRELGSNPDAATSQVPFSDLRRVTYWLASTGGLARQEVKVVISDDATANVPPNIPDEASHVFADEVKNLAFSYWDGSNWQDSWDGSQTGPDGVTPLGPPVAIAVDMEIATGANTVQHYHHVIAIPTANGPGQPAATSQNQQQGTTGSGQ